MKLSFAKNDLLNAIQIVQSSIAAKSTLPILSNILIQAAGNKVRLEATDLEVGVVSTVKAEVLEEGKITLPAKKFGEIVRELPGEKEIEISCKDGKKVEIKSGKIRASLHSISPEDFPTIPDFPENKAFGINRQTFKEMIKKTSFATSTDETRHILNGINFMAGQGKLRMVATDGRRLAFIARGSDQKEINASAIIPSKAISELSRLLSLDSAPEDILEIAPFDNQISFRWSCAGEKITLVSRVIDGTFPNYEQVIPKTKEVELKIKTEVLAGAVKRASLFAQDRVGSVRLVLNDKSLKISANSQGIGEAEEELEVDYTGKDFEIAFNPAFMMDILKNNDSSEVCLEFTSALNPGLIKPAQTKEQEEYLCVIMPMRLQ